MSRSYKHTPYCGDKKSHFFKRQANKKLRRKKLAHDLQHKSYRKDFCSWNICDYGCIETKNFEEYYRRQVSDWKNDRWRRRNEPFPTREKIWNEYQKWYIRK